jgi:hypothetical protein
VPTSQALELQGHDHEVVQLAHAGFIEAHDGGVGQALKGGTQGAEGVHCLRAEHVSQKLGGQQGTNHLRDHCVDRGFKKDDWKNVREKKKEGGRKKKDKRQIMGLSGCCHTCLVITERERSSTPGLNYSP